MVRFEIQKVALNSTALVGVLVFFGFVPIAVWVAMAADLEAEGLARSIGKAILVVLSPGLVAGLLMILGAILLRRTRRAGRIYATIGAAIMTAGTGFLSAWWLAHVSHCFEPGSPCLDRAIEGGAGLAYAVVHALLIVLLWRGNDRGDAHIAARRT